MSKTDLPTFTVKQLLESGAHFGHKTMRRNPKMEPYIFDSRNNVSIINLNKTSQQLVTALKTVKEVAKNNGKILFVATKKQAGKPISEAAKRCGQHYVNFRWLGGMLTNWKTVSKSIQTLNQIESQLKDDKVGYSKKEKLNLDRERIKLEKTLGGIRNMDGYPDLIFIIDINKESIALLEARKLGIPIMAIVDTNCNPDNVTFPIAANDDSAKTIRLISYLLSEAALSGLKESMIASGIDVSKIEDISDLKSVKVENSTPKADTKKAVPKKSETKEVKAKEEKVEVVSKKEESKTAATKDDKKETKAKAAAEKKKPSLKKKSLKSQQQKKLQPKLKKKSQQQKKRLQKSKIF